MDAEEAAAEVDAAVNSAGGTRFGVLSDSVRRQLRYLETLILVLAF